MLLRFRYILSELPDDGYMPRLADDRVGHFVDQTEDYTDDRNYSPSRRYIRRWRLEKEDPAAAVSRPKKPIVFWLENTVPVKYRQALREGIEMWNPAFEKIGFRGAIEVRQQPDNPDWDAADIRYNTVRWINVIDSAFAQGPSRSNPYTGELYDADIRFTESMTRFGYREVREQIFPQDGTEIEDSLPYQAPWSIRGRSDFCNIASGALTNAAFSSDVLAARGISPDGPEAEKFVQDLLRSIMSHEVGHTLGLRHNYRASTTIELSKLQDTSLTKSQGLTGSVMEYIPTNLAPKGAAQGEYFQSVLGPYDYWAIEYAYKPIQAGSPREELAELGKIASRAAEPLLAYATDEDAGFSSRPLDMDPTANRWDIGRNPLEYYRHVVLLSEEVLANAEKKLEKPSEGYQVLRRAVAGAAGQRGLALWQTARFIGGVYYNRDHVGDPGGRPPYQPVPASQQKEALQLLSEQLFSPGAYQMPPRLLNKLAGERFRNPFSSEPQAMEFPIHSLVLAHQKRVLDRLFHPVVLGRIVDSELRYTDRADAFRLNDLFSGLHEAIWLESPKTRNAGMSHRRLLQREHLRKLIGLVLKDGGAPEDARTLARHYLTRLRSQLQAASPAATEARAHVSESLARIDEALKAGMERTAF
jgi:hypothetical protein